MKAIHMIGFLLVIVGGLNWGLIGLGWLINGSDWNVVHMIFSFSMQVEAIVYVLVGLSAVWLLVTHRKDCKACMSK